MGKLNEYIVKCVDEIESRGLCEIGDEARPAFLMIATTDSPADENANISTVMGGDSERMIAAIAAVFDNNPVLASIFKIAIEVYQTKKMRTGVKCNTEC